MGTLYDILGHLSVVLLFIALIIGIVKIRSFTKNEKWYIYYIIFIVFIESNSYVFLPLLGIKSIMFLYPVYIAGEFFTVTGIFIKKLNLSKKYFIATALLSLFFLTADRTLVHYQYNNDYSKAISNLIMISLIGYSLIKDIKNVKTKSPFQLNDKMFFLYFTVSIFMFLIQNQLIFLSKDQFATVWVINNLMVCILYSLFIKTFLQLKK
ncbi:hypothetical protein BXY58_0008 [Epilithonimonas arachidiradicis]|uniref:YhhN-like protein n=1 Tax=Epilithonimonas arachidiradicis TaxID=1617282 RepID=A0A420DBZ3_9FLAO|nr:hypothetical protein BXY58_0008 [Epilithonimonas arachidiradicis]GGG42492.1 hypothetical protein GCM10007332_00070 [Epilithonimonas arachidiradicis]